MRNRCVTFVPDSLAEHAARLLDEADGDLRVADLARHLGVGIRTLQTRFLDAVGITSKEYARVRRLQALLRALRGDRDGEDVLRLAAAFVRGKSDQ